MTRHTSPHLAALLLRLLLGAGVVGGGLLAYALAVEPNRLQITHTDIALPRLPAAWDGLRILLLTDPHLTRWGKREDTLLRLLSGVERPDLIIWGGDFLQGQFGTNDAIRLCREVAALFPDTPAYTVWGNAEHKISRARRDAFRADLEAACVHVLVNEWTTLTLRGAAVTLAGVDDPYYGHSDLRRALRNAPPAGEQFRLLLSHSPQLATQAARAGVDLMLSGHTHGGQVRVPFIGPVKTQNPLARRLDMGLWYPADLARVLGRDPGGDLTTYISRGIGVANIAHAPWLAPRFLCRPEIAVLRLRCGTERQDNRRASK